MMKLGKLLLLAVAVFVASPLWAMQLSPVSGEKRQADRDAIRAHIDKIFQAYIHKDGDVIRATHATEWRGFNSSSKTEVRGIDRYMQDVEGYLKGPVRMSAYKMLEFDVIFYGDTAMIPYVADVTYEFPGGSVTEKLRVLDVYAKLADGWNQVGSDTQLHPDSLEAQQSEAAPAGPEMKKSLMDAREAVWRDWFSNNRAHLEQVIPPETIAIDADSEKFENRDDILAGARSFAEGGGKLTRLEFPETEIQVYGSIAILYSKYAYELDVNGKPIAQSGRATEVFVYRDGKWLNSGWHLDSGK